MARNVSLRYSYNAVFQAIVEKIEIRNKGREGKRGNQRDLSSRSDRTIGASLLPNKDGGNCTMGRGEKGRAGE